MIDLHNLTHTGEELEAAIERVFNNYRDVYGVTAQPGDILAGKSIVTLGGAVEGDMPDIGDIFQRFTIKNQIAQIAAGHHSGGGTVAIDQAEQDKLISGNIRYGVDILGVTGELVPASNPPTQAYLDIMAAVNDPGITTYTATMPGGEMIVSSDQFGFGTWLLKDNDAVQVSQDNKTTLQPVGTDYCVCGGNTVGILLINTLTGEANVVYTTAVWSAFTPIANRYVVCGAITPGSGVVLVDVQEKTAVPIYSDGSNWVYQKKVANRFCICSSGTTGTNGFVLVDTQEKTAVRLTLNYYNWQYMVDVDDRYCVCGSPSTNTGIAIIDVLEATVLRIYPTGYGWRYMTVIANRYVVCSADLSGAAMAGIVVIDTVELTAAVVYPTGYGWAFGKQLGDNYCACGSSVNSSASLGIVIVDVVNKTAERVRTTGYNFSNLHAIPGTNKGLASSTNINVANSPGIVQFEGGVSGSTLLYPSGFNWNEFEDDDTGVNISIANNPGAPTLRYDKASNTITQVA